MLVASIAGDEHATLAVLAGQHDAQVPEANVVELGMEVEARRLMEQSQEVEVVRRAVFGQGCMKEEPLAHVDAAEELPVALQLRLHDSVSCGRREAVEELVQLLRAEDGQHHS